MDVIVDISIAIKCSTRYASFELYFFLQCSQIWNVSYAVPLLRMVIRLETSIFHLISIVLEQSYKPLQGQAKNMSRSKDDNRKSTTGLRGKVLIIYVVIISGCKINNGTKHDVQWLKYHTYDHLEYFAQWCSIVLCNLSVYAHRMVAKSLAIGYSFNVDRLLTFNSLFLWFSHHTRTPLIRVLEIIVHI